MVALETVAVTFVVLVVPVATVVPIMVVVPPTKDGVESPGVVTAGVVTVTTGGSEIFSPVPQL